MRISREERKAEIQRLINKINEPLDAPRILREEFERLNDVAKNMPEHLENLDREFEQETGLMATDISLLLLCTGLQVLKTYLVNSFTQLEKAGQGNRIEQATHKLQDKVDRYVDSGEDTEDRMYYASLKHITSRYGVPYDATAFEAGNNTGQFKGANHRFATLGHDPLVGLVFGTANIMTNTITFADRDNKILGISIPESRHVVYSSDYKDPRISAAASTMVLLGSMAQRSIDEPKVLACCLIKQVMHIASDLYTTCGIQIPAANLVFDRAQVEYLTKNLGINTGNLIKIGTSMKVGELINAMITILHRLMYDAPVDGDEKLYEVRTRKILLYSNSLATGSNIIYTAVSGDLRKLDLGGLIVTLRRLFSDVKFIREVKREFLEEGMAGLIEGAPDSEYNKMLEELGIE